jgi:hypothetical protein
MSIKFACVTCARCEARTTASRPPARLDSHADPTDPPLTGCGARPTPRRPRSIAPVHGIVPDDREFDAAMAVDFTLQAVEEAEYEVLDAILARAEANEMMASTA